MPRQQKLEMHSFNVVAVYEGISKHCNNNPVAVLSTATVTIKNYFFCELKVIH